MHSGINKYSKYKLISQKKSRQYKIADGLQIKKELYGRSAMDFLPSENIKGLWLTSLINNYLEIKNK